MSEDPLLEPYFARTTPEAAAACRRAIDYILQLDPRITYTLNKATIDFRAERQFCSLWPVKNHVTFWITKGEAIPDPGGRLRGEGRTANLRLRRLSDFDEEVKALVHSSFENEGLRPLKQR